MNDVMLLTAKRRLKLYFNCRRRFLETDNHDELEFGLLYLKEATELLIHLHQHGLTEATSLLAELEAKRHIKLPTFIQTMSECPAITTSRYRPFLSFCVCTCSSLLMLTPFYQHFIAKPATIGVELVTPDVATSSVNSTLIAPSSTSHESLLLIRNALRAYHMDHGIFPQQLTDLQPSYLKIMPNEAAYVYRPHSDDALTVDELVIESLQPKTDVANYYFSPLQLHVCLSSHELFVADEHYIYFVFKLEEMNHRLTLDEKSIDFLRYVTVSNTPVSLHHAMPQFYATFSTSFLYYYPIVEKNHEVVQKGLHNMSDLSLAESTWLQEIGSIYDIPDLN